MEEQWKTIQGYEQYEVSSEGRIRNKKTGKILKPAKHSTGYLQVMLCKNGKVKNFLVHRLVAIHFIPNPHNKPTVNHIDENKENNNVSNLEWATMKEQLYHGTRTERQAKAISKKVYCVELDQTFDSIREAERLTGVAHQNISKACKGKYKTAGKMHWKYVDES